MTSVVDQLTRVLSAQGAALFRERLIMKSVNRHQELIAKGDVVSGAYFVLDGGLRVYTLGANGREATLYGIEVGETCVLALNALFNNLLYPAWVETEVDSVLGILPGEAYRTLFATETAFQDMTIKALSSALFGLMIAAEGRETQTVTQRLANYLLLKADAEHRLVNTQQHIADRIGTTREVVGRHMADFASRGLLQTGRGRIAILDVQRLRSLVG